MFAYTLPPTRLFRCAGVSVTTPLAVVPEKNGVRSIPMGPFTPIPPECRPAHGVAAGEGTGEVAHDRPAHSASASVDVDLANRPAQTLDGDEELHARAAERERRRAAGGGRDRGHLLIARKPRQERGLSRGAARGREHQEREQRDRARGSRAPMAAVHASPFADHGVAGLISPELTGETVARPRTSPVELLDTPPGALDHRR